MKKLFLILMAALLSGFAYSQQTVSAPPVRFKIHKEKCMVRHERNGIRHDFRKFHRYQHFKQMRHRHKMHRRAIRRSLR
ncbi:MAG: hypothetical protein JJE25_04175 [Bacteroidia bacterium]|nr:hypothetical protein [Bacteroidia bacterium]